jgi:hypothetical protein
VEKLYNFLFHIGEKRTVSTCKQKSVFLHLKFIQLQKENLFRGEKQKLLPKKRNFNKNNSSSVLKWKKKNITKAAGPKFTVLKHVQRFWASFVRHLCVIIECFWGAKIY